MTEESLEEILITHQNSFQIIEHIQILIPSHQGPKKKITTGLLLDLIKTFKGKHKKGSSNQQSILTNDYEQNVEIFSS